VSRLCGKKVGKYCVETVLASYDLDVRLNMEGAEFTIHVPHRPGEKAAVTPHGPNYETFSSKSLDELEGRVKEYLVSRDTTTFEDVIEYNLIDSHGYRSLSETDNDVGFDFRVARVSLAKDRNGRPKLEISLDVDGDGCLSVADWCGKLASPQAHQFRFCHSMPYTADRWRKCCAIRSGIADLRKRLTDLLGEGGDKAACRLDGVEDKSPLLAEVKR
jgi:hypothetical protein